MQYDNRGKVSLWKNDREGDRQPVLKEAGRASRSQRRRDDRHRSLETRRDREPARDDGQDL